MVGLGNPGGRYAATRHNVGYRVVDELAHRGGIHVVESRWNALSACLRRDDVEVWLIKPTTWMNDSGRAARRAVETLGIEPEQLLVICDDFHLELGRLRARRTGGAGGHNGLESVLMCLRMDEFPRLRIGIGEAPPGRAVQYVLEPFGRADEAIIAEAVVRAADAVAVWLDHGIDEVMNRFN